MVRSCTRIQELKKPMALAPEMGEVATRPTTPSNRMKHTMMHQLSTTPGPSKDQPKQARKLFTQPMKAMLFSHHPRTHQPPPWS